MRVVIVGATSHIASTLVPYLLESPYVHTLVLLSRASITSAKILSNPKVTQILCQDLSRLPPQLFVTAADPAQRISAVIWLVGGPPSRFKTADDAHTANVDLPLLFLEKCLESGVVPLPSGLDPSGEEPVTTAKQGRYSAQSAKMPFRFVYLSIRGAEQNQFRGLWQNGSFRKMKGAAERALLDLADEKGQGMLEVYCLRLGSVLAGGQTTTNVVWEGVGGYISDQLVAKKVLALCLDGRGNAKYGQAEGGGVLENEECLGAGWADINTIF